MNTAKNDEEIAPQVTLILAIWNLERYFLLSKRKLKQVKVVLGSDIRRADTYTIVLSASKM